MIALGIPHAGTILPKTMLTVLGTVFETGIPIHVIEQGGCYLEENRTKIVRQAQRAQCTHLLFVDADMFFPPQTLTKLLAHGKPIVGAAYNYRRLPLESTVKIAGPDGRLVAVPHIPTEPFQCAAVATGCVLIDLAVFDKVPLPWFHCTYTDQGDLDQGDDYWFCRQAAQAGYEIWCDPTLDVKHLGEFAF